MDTSRRARHAVVITMLGPSGSEADYSNYGTEQISVAAPGGWFRDGIGTPAYRTPENEILSTYPKKVLQEEGLMDAAGVAALIVSRYGRPDRAHPGTLGLSPDLVERVLTRTAAAHACPEPRLRSYVPKGRDAGFDAYCAGGVDFNGFYGHGVVDAYAAVTARTLDG